MSEMNLQDSIHTPWDRMTDAEQAYWDDICECGHTRLTHDVTWRGNAVGARCSHWQERGKKRRERCRRFRYSMSFDQFAEETAKTGPFAELIQQIERMRMRETREHDREEFG